MMNSLPIKRLGDVCTVVTGTTPSTSISEYWGGDIKWITPAEIADDTFFVNDSVRKITQRAVNENSLIPLPPGTVILSSRAPIGKVAIAGTELYCNQGFKNLICGDEIDNLYLFFFLKSRTEYLNSLGSGATFKEISKKVVEQIQIPCPPLSEQRAIASALKAKLDTIAAIEGKTTKQIEELGAWVEKFVQEKLVDSANEKWESGIIENYVTINPSIRELLIRPDDSLPVSFVPMPAVSDEFGCINQDIIRLYHEVKKGYTYFREQDVIFAKITPCMQNGKSAVATSLKNGIGFGSTEFHVLRSNGAILPEWLHLFLRRKNYLRKAEEHMQGAVGQQRLPESFLRETSISFPKAFDTQRAIVEEVMTKIKKSYSIKHKLTQQLTNLASLRSALYREAFGAGE